MKVLHVAESILGGVGSYLAQLVPLQSAVLGEASVRIVAPREHVRQLTPTPHAQIRPFARPDRSMASIAALAATVAVEVREFRPDVVHAHSTFAGLVVRSLYGWRPGRPAIVYCPHGWSFAIDTMERHAHVQERLEALLSTGCDAVVAISAHEAEEAIRIGITPAKVRTVLNGVGDLEGEQAAWNDARLKVLFVGRLDRQKGVDTLVKAVGPLGDQVSLRLVGAAVAGRPAAVAQADHIEMLGWLSQTEVAAQMRAADVVVAPSRWEGFGLVAIEAMRAGRPVVASRVGGLPEVVDDGVTGVLVEPDQPEALRRALLSWDRSAWARAGVEGRKRYLDCFTAERMSRDILRVYDDCLAARAEGYPRSALDGAEVPLRRAAS